MQCYYSSRCPPLVVTLTNKTSCVTSAVSGDHDRSNKEVMDHVLPCTTLSDKVGLARREEVSLPVFPVCCSCCLRARRWQKVRFRFAVTQAVSLAVRTVQLAGVSPGLQPRLHPNQPAGTRSPADPRVHGEAKWKWTDEFCSSERTSLITGAAEQQEVCRVLGEGRHLPSADDSISIITCEASGGADTAGGREPASEPARLLVVTDAVCCAFIYLSKWRADKCPQCAKGLCHQDVFLKKCFWHLTSLASQFVCSSAPLPARPRRQRSIMI